jgi:hypothetical protein
MAWLSRGREERRGKNGKDWRSLLFAQAFGSAWISLNHAIHANPSERTRTLPSRQAGGHWFEPSTAHISSCKAATSVASFANEIG